MRGSIRLVVGTKLKSLHPCCHGGGVSVCGRGLYAERYLQVLDQHMLPPSGVFFQARLCIFQQYDAETHESVTAAWHHSTQCADRCGVQFHQLQTSGAPWNHKNTTRPELISVSAPWLHSEWSLYLNTTWLCSVSRVSGQLTVWWCWSWT